MPDTVLNRVGAALLLIAVAAPCAASDQTPAPVSRLLACRQTTDPAQRLACYDREAGAFDDKLVAGKVVVIDKADVKAAQRSRFGLAAPGLDLFAGKDGERLSSINAVVDIAGLDQFGKLIIALSDHSRWRQIDDYPIARLPRGGDTVVISRAALGSFMMRFGKQAEVRVHRIS